MMTAAGVFITGFSSILTGLELHRHDPPHARPGLTWSRLPLFLWAIYATSLIMVLATPVLAVSLLLIFMERCLGIGIFDPKLGGDPVLFQHLFWFYSHPAVYIMVLPAIGRHQRDHRLLFAAAAVRLHVHRLFELCHRDLQLFGVGTPHVRFAGNRFMPASSFRSSASSWRSPRPSKCSTGPPRSTRPSLVRNADALRPGLHRAVHDGRADRAVSVDLGVDVHVHDTYFVVAHFHYIMVGGTVMAYLGGIHYWWPKMTGRMYPENWARLSAILIFIGFNLTFFPQFILGYLGMPRRYHVYPAEFQVLNVMSSAGASILAVGYAFPLTYLLWSLRWGRIAPPNPWRATGLEWHTQSPPPTHNFEVTPIVREEAYAYDVLDASQLAGEPRARGGAHWLKATRCWRTISTISTQQRDFGRAGDVAVPGDRSVVFRRPVPGLHAVSHGQRDRPLPTPAPI